MRERAKRHSLVEHPPKNAKWHSPSVGARIAPDPAGQRVLPPPDGLSLGQDIDACGSGRVCDSGNRSRTDGCRPDGRLQRTLKTGSGQQQAVDTGEVESWLRGEQRAFLTLWERLWEWLRRCSRNWLCSQIFSGKVANTLPLLQFLLQLRDLFVELGDLNEQQRAQLPNRARQSPCPEPAAPASSPPRSASSPARPPRRSPPRRPRRSSAVSRTASRRSVGPASPHGRASQSHGRTSGRRPSNSPYPPSRRRPPPTDTVTGVDAVFVVRDRQRRPRHRQAGRAPRHRDRLVPLAQRVRRIKARFSAFSPRGVYYTDERLMPSNAHWRRMLNAASIISRRTTRLSVGSRAEIPRHCQLADLRVQVPLVVGEVVTGRIQVQLVTLRAADPRA